MKAKIMIIVVACIMVFLGLMFCISNITPPTTPSKPSDVYNIYGNAYLNKNKPQNETEEASVVRMTDEMLEVTDAATTLASACRKSNYAQSLDCKQFVRILNNDDLRVAIWAGTVHDPITNELSRRGILAIYVYQINAIGNLWHDVK